jgi:hypothetical protein
VTLRLHTASGSIILGDPPPGAPRCDVCQTRPAAVEVEDDACEAATVHACEGCAEHAIGLTASMAKRINP